MSKETLAISSLVTKQMESSIILKISYLMSQENPTNIHPSFKIEKASPKSSQNSHNKWFGKQSKDHEHNIMKLTTIPVSNSNLPYSKLCTRTNRY